MCKVVVERTGRQSLEGRPRRAQDVIQSRPPAIATHPFQRSEVRLCPPDSALPSAHHCKLPDSRRVRFEHALALQTPSERAPRPPVYASTPAITARVVRTSKPVALSAVSYRGACRARRSKPEAQKCSPSPYIAGFLLCTSGPHKRQGRLDATPIHPGRTRSILSSRFKATASQARPSTERIRVQILSGCHRARTTRYRAPGRRRSGLSTVLPER